MTIEAYVQAHGGVKPKRKGGVKDFLQQFAPGVVPPGGAE